MPSKTRLLLIAKLGAFALFLSTLEYLIPKPVPFMRIGLANVPVMLSLALLSPADYALLVILKVAGQALVTGTLFSYVFLFSLGGSAAAALVMFILYHLLGRRVSFVGIGIAGALASNGVQLLLAGVFIFGPSITLVAPPFLIMGFFSSAALGLFAQRFSTVSSWFRDRALHESREDVLPKSPGGRSPVDWRLITGLVVLPAFLLQPSLTGTLLLAAAALAAAAAVGRRIRILPNVLVLISVVLANLLQANGMVLFTLGNFSVTGGALKIGLEKAFTLIGLIYLSQYMVSRRPKLPGVFGRVISLQLYYFERITETWRAQKEGGLIPRLDALLYRLDDTPAVSAEGSGEGISAAGKVLGILFAAAAWGLLFV